MVGTKCVPTYGAVGGGSLLGPTAAAGWAAVASSHHQPTWWHWLQAGKLDVRYKTGSNDGDEESCGNDDD